MKSEESISEQSGGFAMPQKDIPKIILELKKAKSEKEITYPRLLDMLEAAGTPLGLTTLRRVFADGSEKNDSFNYQSTIAPLEAILLQEDIPEPENNPYIQELEGHKAVIHAQNEELVRAYQMIEHLEDRIRFLVGQIDKKDRRMDEKDDIIRRFMTGELSIRRGSSDEGKKEE